VGNRNQIAISWDQTLELGTQGDDAAAVAIGRRQVQPFTHCMGFGRATEEAQLGRIGAAGAGQAHRQQVVCKPETMRVLGMENRYYMR
jgi:hypothetical protein